MYREPVWKRKQSKWNAAGRAYRGRRSRQQKHQRDLLRRTVDKGPELSEKDENGKAARRIREKLVWSNACSRNNNKSNLLNRLFAGRTIEGRGWGERERINSETRACCLFTLRETERERESELGFWGRRNWKRKYLSPSVCRFVIGMERQFIGEGLASVGVVREMIALPVGVSSDRVKVTVQTFFPWAGPTSHVRGKPNQKKHVNFSLSYFFFVFSADFFNNKILFYLNNYININIINNLIH